MVRAICLETGYTITDLTFCPKKLQRKSPGPQLVVALDWADKFIPPINSNGIVTNLFKTNLLVLAPSSSYMHP